ncbi:unannotated protein [freshwater metagenome]|uniref:Unannotated protein n=1 Tax=freshwater metagenome TaxID=449393 RepID=A0A6J6W052_9ZZZZ
MELSLENDGEHLIILGESVAKRFSVFGVVVTAAVLLNDGDDLSTVEATVRIDCINGGLNLLDDSIGATVVRCLEAQGFLEGTQVRDDVADFD